MSTNKFIEGDVVKHVKSGGLYRIAVVPPNCMIEKDWKPAYGYKADNQLGSPLIIRPKDEMEDGRFTLWWSRSLKQRLKDPNENT